MLPCLLKQGVVLFQLSKLQVSGLAILMSWSKCAGVVAASGWCSAGKLHVLFTTGLKSTAFLTRRLFVYCMHAPETSVRVCCAVSSLNLSGLGLEAFTILRLWSFKLCTWSGFGISWVPTYDYTQKYVKGDQKGSSLSFAFGTTSGGPFSELMAFKKGNATRTFCFLFCTSIFWTCSLLAPHKWNWRYWSCGKVREDH